MTTKSASFNEDGPAKKPYESPRLDVYGDIRDVTDSTASDGKPDGSAHGNVKTG